MLAGVLWLSFVPALLLALAGLHRGGPAGLRLSAVASAVMLVCSFLGGFSIGLFSAAVPTLVTALAVTSGRRAAWRAIGVLIGVAAYVLLTWVVPFVIPIGEIIPLALLSGAAYLVAYLAGVPRDPQHR